MMKITVPEHKQRPNSTPLWYTGGLPTGELAKIHLKVEFDPGPRKTHAHIQHSLAKVCSKLSDAARAALCSVASSF